MTTFSELCAGYRQSIASMVIIDAALPGDRPFEEKVLMHKLHKWADDPRNAAKYIAAYLECFGRSCDLKSRKAPELPPEARAVAARLRLKWEPEFGVGYPHADGRYHFFSV